MKAIILFEPGYASTDAIGRATAHFMTIQQRVRLVSTSNLVVSDLDEVGLLVRACSPDYDLAPSLLQALRRHCDAGMRQMSLPDFERMLWFQTEGARLAAS